jgi:hypothetical protein
MDVLEALVRDTLTEHANDAPSADGLLEAVTASRGRTRWLAAASVAALLLAAGLAILMTQRPAAQSSGSATGRPTPTINDMPKLERIWHKTVAYRGVVLTVPDNLTVHTNECALPASYVLAEDPNVAVSCVSGGVPASQQKVTVVLTDQTAVVTTPAHLHRVQQTVRVRGTDVLVTVTAPSRDTVDRILAGVKVAADPNGCPARLTAPSRRWVSGQTGTTLVRCVYATTGWLQASLRLGSADVVAGRIAALPMNVNEGVSTSGYEHDLLRFSYPDGTTQVISADLGSPSLFVDGTRVVRDVGNRVADLIRRLSS